MAKIFLIGPIDIFVTLIADLKRKIPNIIIDQNYEQVLGFVKKNEAERICIWMDAWNYSGNKYGSIRGQGAAENFHKINPAIPILVWDGREYDCPIEMSPALQVYGNIHPIKNDNELYLSFNYEYSRKEQIKIIKKFFDGTLTTQDIPCRACLDMNRSTF